VCGCPYHCARFCGGSRDCAAYGQHVGGQPFRYSSVYGPIARIAGGVDGTNVLPRLMLRAEALMLTPSPSELEIAQLAQDERCLAEAIYYEARGEGTDGQMAIAEVVFHRLHHHGYPGSICGVVYQGVGAGISCQFSFVCNGEMLRKKTPADWYRAKRLAARIISGIIQLGNSTDGATSFHAADVEPGWSDSLERTVQIGNHIFYKPLARSQAS